MSDSDSGAPQLSSRSKIAIGIWVIGVIVVLAFTFSSFGGGSGLGAGEPTTTTSPDTDSGEMQGVAIGSKAPGARLELGNDSTVSLDDFAGERVLLWFPVPTCETCQIQASRLAANRSKLENLTIIAVTPRSETESGDPTGTAFAEAHAPATLEESNWYWGVPSAELIETYNPDGVHGLGYLIDRNGNVVARGSKPADNVHEIARFANGST